MALPSRTLTQAERLDWLRLIRTENVGPIIFQGLVQRFGSAGAALDALPELARGGRAHPAAQALPEGRSRARTRRPGAARRAAGGAVRARLPEALAHIDDAPPLLAVKGHAHLLQGRSIAMVGARNASLNGRRFAEQVAGELGRAGLVVVSGLVRGIDAAAHAGALATGTIAVMAGGIDVVYPPENAALCQQIAEAGLLVSECASGTQPTACHFPRHNRLISGLSLGVVVVEATPRSGSLITARLAAEQGREVFAVPGSPLDPRPQGCNALIRKGATLVQSADDILWKGSPP